MPTKEAAPLLAHFPVAKTQFTSEGFYSVIDPSKSYRNEVYFCTPLTSGGARRTVEHLPKEELKAKIPEVIKKNGQFVEAIAQELAPTLEGIKIALPHRFSEATVLQSPPWEALDYIKLCLYYISGIPPEAAVTFQKKIEQDQLVNGNRFNAFHNDRERQLSREEHLRFGEQFVEYTVRESVPLNPVRGLVLNPDHHRSSGCSVERNVSAGLGIPIQEVIIAPKHPRFMDRFGDHANWLTADLQAPHLMHTTADSLVTVRPYIAGK